MRQRLLLLRPLLTPASAALPVLSTLPCVSFHHQLHAMVPLLRSPWPPSSLAGPLSGPTHSRLRLANAFPRDRRPLGPLPGPILGRRVASLLSAGPWPAPDPHPLGPAGAAGSGFLAENAPARHPSSPFPPFPFEWRAAPRLSPIPIPRAAVPPQPRPPFLRPPARPSQRPPRARRRRRLLLRRPAPGSSSWVAALAASTLRSGWTRSPVSPMHAAS